MTWAVFVRRVILCALLVTLAAVGFVALFAATKPAGAKSNLPCARRAIMPPGRDS